MRGLKESNEREVVDVTIKGDSESHPSYGVVNVYRVSSNPAQRVFGSDGKFHEVAAKASKPELRVPQVDDGDWTPGSFGWYIHQANIISSLNSKQGSLAACYLARVVIAQEKINAEREVDAGARPSRSAKVHAKRRSGRKVGR